MIKDIRHTGIIVTDMEKALGFYRDLLGLRVVADKPVSGEYVDKIIGLDGVDMRLVMLQAPDGGKVELFEFHSHIRKAPEKVETCDIGCSHIAFSIDDADAAYKKLSEHGIKFNSEPLVSPDGYAKAVYCHDPDGTIIELTQVLDTGSSPYKS